MWWTDFRDDGQLQIGWTGGRHLGEKYDGVNSLHVCQSMCLTIGKQNNMGGIMSAWQPA